MVFGCDEIGGVGGLVQVVVGCESVFFVIVVDEVDWGLVIDDQFEFLDQVVDVLYVGIGIVCFEGRYLMCSVIGKEYVLVVYVVDVVVGELVD